MPFHIDEELARSCPASGLIAPFTYTLSIISLGISADSFHMIRQENTDLFKGREIPGSADNGNKENKG